jgi:hypothetical protein
LKPFPLAYPYGRIGNLATREVSELSNDSSQNGDETTVGGEDIEDTEAYQEGYRAGYEAAQDEADEPDIQSGNIAGDVYNSGHGGAKTTQEP